MQYSQKLQKDYKMFGYMKKLKRKWHRLDQTILENFIDDEISYLYINNFFLKFDLRKRLIPYRHVKKRAFKYLDYIPHLSKDGQ